MMTELMEKLNNEMAALLAKARPALVEIRGRNRSVGAGTIWHPSGMVVTNTHVLEGKKVEIALAEEEREMLVEGARNVRQKIGRFL